LPDAIFRWKAVRPDFAISIGPSKYCTNGQTKGVNWRPFSVLNGRVERERVEIAGNA
jgi:hypothetical protein